MAQSATTTSATVFVPGAYVETKVETPNSGLSTTGVLMLVGEADGGPSFSEESDITTVSFGPDALASVVAKYKSGPIVDAFRIACAAANDNNIQGSPASIFIAKTNISARASGALTRSGLTTGYGTVFDKGYGFLGNQINATVTSSVPEVVPTTGAFTFIPSPVASTLAVRVNGLAQQTLAIGAKTIPSALVGTQMASSLNSLSVGGINMLNATGGQDRTTVQAGLFGTNVTLAVNGNAIFITLSSGSWSVTPTVGDTLIIPATGEYGAAGNSVIKGATNKNFGAYVVISASSTLIVATKLRDNSGVTVTAPEAVGAVALAAVTDILCYAPIVVSNFTGTERSVLTGLVGQTVTGTASGSQLTLTLQTAAQWNALPQVGDLVMLSSTAPAAWRDGGVGASAKNVGWYQVIAATSSTLAGGSTIVMTRLSNGSPGSFSATAIAAVTDLRVLRPAIDGVGKSLELFDGAGTESIVTPGMFYNLNTSLVTWVSTVSSPQLLVSSAEYVASLVASRSADSITDTLTAGGDVVLKLCYHGGATSGVTGTVTVSGTTLTTTVTGGTGANLSVDLTKFNTLNDLAIFLNTQTGYSCSVGSALFGQQVLTYVDASNAKQTVLDKGTFGIASSNKALAGRIKKDGYAFFKKLQDTALLVQLGSPNLAASAGLPEVQSMFFLSGGTKGGTSNARVTAAIDAMEKVRGNFLIPLFSRDATSDITDGLTESASTYTIDSINAYALSHCLALSNVKRKRNRQAFVSKRDSFANAKLAANNLASARASMTFQDFKFVDGTGTIKQFQPWAGAVDAAAMQAAAFYKAIVKKFIATSGVLMADGSYSDQLISNVEDALKNGLLPAERAETGGYRWVSDQTTYAVDSNFVYNSIQAVYALDTIALTLAQRLENAFVGQSVADASAGLILSNLQAIMADIKRLKLTASSTGAELGYRNPLVTISGPAAYVSIEIKLAGALYFIPVNVFVTQVSQSASS